MHCNRFGRPNLERVDRLEADLRKELHERLTSMSIEAKFDNIETRLGG